MQMTIEAGISERQRVVALWAAALSMLVLGKAVTEIWVNWNLWAVLLPMCAGMAILAYLSPPVAAAFFFLGNYFFGNLSVAFHPRMSFLTVLAAVLLGSLLVARWKRGDLSRFLVLPKRVWLALAALGVFLLLGFTRTMWEAYAFLSGSGYSDSVMAVVKESLSGNMRGNTLLSHYMFLSHWLTFFMIGALACLSRADLKTFFLAFSLLFVVQLLAIPFYYFPQFFREIYSECLSLGLGYAQANRGNIGYMATVASGFALTMAHNGKRPLYLLAWWLVLSSFVFISASKGPVLAWLIATIYILWSGRRLDTPLHRALLKALGMLVSVALLSAAFGYSIVPCGLVKKLGEDRHSVEVRVAMARDRLASYLPVKAGETVHLPDGKQAHLSSEDAILYRIVEHETANDPNRDAWLAGVVAGMHYQREGTAEASQRPDGDVSTTTASYRSGSFTWLLGSGFGGSTRSFDHESKSFRAHAGSLNLFIDLFIETGVVGLSLFVFAVVALWRHFRNSALAGMPMDGRLLVTGTCAMVLVVLVKVNVAAETSTEDLAALTIGLLTGMALISVRRPGDSRPPSAPRHP